MALAGEIAVNVIARTRGYTSGLNRAKKETVGFQSAVSGTIGKIGSFIGVAGGLTGALLAASRAMRGLRDQMLDLDAGIKTAARLGLTHAQLTGLHNAAELSGVGVSTLDMALQRMTRRIAEAAQGTGEAKAALAELGLSAKSLAQIGPYQSFLRIAEAMKSVQGQSDKVRLAFKLFDSEGVKLVNTLAMGAEALEAFQIEAIKTGQALDALSERQIQEANDAVTKARQGWDALKTGLAVRFAPVIEGHGKTMEWIGKTVAGTGREYEELHRVLGEVVPPMSAVQIGGRASEVQALVQAAKIRLQATKAREAEARAAKEQETTEQKITETIMKRQRSVGAAARGTTEAFSAIVEGRAERREQLAIEKKQLEEQKLGNRHLGDVANNVRQLAQGGRTLVVRDLKP